MTPTRFAFVVSHSLKTLLGAAALLAGCQLSALADVPKSLLPAFGNDGTEFTVNAKNGNTVKGWLPKDWTDNTDWAPVTATYTKLTDSPDKDAGAVRIKIDKVEEGGLLQLTTYAGNQHYKKGGHYLVTGWVRSADAVKAKVGAREMNEPYSYFHEQDLAPGKEWKRFEFAFTPTKDFDALIMFVVEDVGTIDLAGIAVEEKP